MDGFLAIDKPAGITSHDVVAAVRRISGVRKSGHAGTLDPMATGLVTVGLGKATRLLRFIADLDKEYRAEVLFGIGTDTLDADGVEVERLAMPITRADLERVLPGFLGSVMQVPPMVSAVRVEGRRLYELAREGKEVYRRPRPVLVREIEIESFTDGDLPRAVLRIVCGKGTYVRVLADDLAKALGGRAHLTALRRLRSGTIVPGPSLDDLAAGEWWRWLIPMEEGLAHLPSLRVDAATAEVLRTGRAIPSWERGLIRVLDEHGRLVGVYRAASGTAIPEVVVA